MPQISERELERVPLRVHQFLAGVRCTTCGRSTYHARAPGSRSTSFYASRTTESTRPRRSSEGCWTYVFLVDASSGATAHAGRA